MSTFPDVLLGLARKLSENYDEHFAQYRFWLDVGSAHGDIVIRDQVCLDAWQMAQANSLNGLIHPTTHVFVRFIGDIEADQVFSERTIGLHKQSYTPILRSFFEKNISLVASPQSSTLAWFLTHVNLIAHWANRGYLEETVIRNHILQALISPPGMRDHQADALIILFKLAGATFDAYAGPLVVDRCFEWLKSHYSCDAVKWNLVQEVVALRESGWEGLPPPPVSTNGEPEPAGPDQQDFAATPVVTPLGLPTDTAPGSPALQSPSISIATLSDFTVADAFDDEPPLDPTAITPHDTLYFEDGNVEVLCGNTLFRAHTSVLSLHSPILGRMLAKANLATAESPNGCPRISSSDTPTDFATLLKIIYLPGFPERNKVPDFTTFSSLLRMTAKYDMPTVRPQVLEVVCGAYPETFGGLDPSKPIGERFFSGSAPHPNEVLNLFVQQNLTSALPMAYYMAARRGLGSLMDRRLPASARLSPEVLQVAIGGLMTLREMELKETHRLIFGSNGPRSCSMSNCPSRNTTSPRVSEAHQKVADRITDSAHPGTKLLQVLSLKEVCGIDCFGFCGSCVGEWEAGHADVRRKAWGALPDVFGLS